MLNNLLHCLAVMDAPVDVLKGVIRVGNFAVGMRPSLLSMLVSGDMIEPLTDVIADKSTGGIRADSLIEVFMSVVVFAVSTLEGF